LKGLQLFPELLDLIFQLGEARANRIAIFSARGAVGHESRTIMNDVDRNRLGRDSDHRLAGRNVFGNNGIGTDLRALAHLDRSEHLRPGSDHHSGPKRRVALAARTRGRVGAAQCHMLVNGDVVADLRALTDHAEAVVEEEALADLGARMDVDPR
jgi:hypothetical protein